MIIPVVVLFPCKIYRNFTKLGRLVLKDINVEGLLTPTWILQTDTNHYYYYYLTRDNMAAQSWRRFIEVLAHSSSDRTIGVQLAYCNIDIATKDFIWAAPSEFVTYRLCEQRRFKRACASAQSRQNLRCSLI